ncbi:uncharacterized protein LOC114528768 [Dendronephthya gigantea]|uniref:uncharacterized protein LOC114528768 n=1 Tax=Dendronephthya gigantea TaxID=151771 RepID=UPI00106B91A0|nr:uncharacterized protein LOC114528768 [Dendronephthya gigantea]
MCKPVVFLLCLGSVVAQSNNFNPQQLAGLPSSWTMNPVNNGPPVPVQPSQQTWSVSPQVYQASTNEASYPTTTESYPTTTTDSNIYSDTTDVPYTTEGTTTEWTTEGLPDDGSQNEKPTVETNQVTKPNDVPGSEIKVALPGNKYEKILVNEINKYRLMHGAAQLRINADLDKKAKLWAQKMAEEDHESVDVNSQYGQLTFSGTSDLAPNVPVAAARHWYNRIKNYAWDKPAVSTKSTQFTQLVWGASQQIGVGIAQDRSGLRTYVAALFSPRGNNKKEIVENVLPVTGTGAGKRGADSCPKGWHRFKKSCYRYFNNNVKWTEAANLCDDEHSSLTSLESVEEEISVRSMLAKDEGTEAWIGLSDRVHPDTKDLIWVDGNSMPYSNWNSYQDDVSEGRKCGALSIATEGWMYKACQEKFGFICKKRLKDIMTYLVVLSFPEKLWSDNLRQETSPRYNAMKKHLDHAIMNLYDDDDWFVDMLFEGFSQTAEDKVTAEFKLRFSPDGDAPSDPLDKLRTKLESDGLVQGEKIFLEHVSLQNGE